MLFKLCIVFLTTNLPKPVVEHQKKLVLIFGYIFTRHGVGGSYPYSKDLTLKITKKLIEVK